MHLQQSLLHQRGSAGGGVMGRGGADALSANGSFLPCNLGGGGTGGGGGGLVRGEGMGGGSWSAAAGHSGNFHNLVGGGLMGGVGQGLAGLSHGHSGMPM